jgi:hypothetical protein
MSDKPKMEAEDFYRWIDKVEQESGWPTGTHAMLSEIKIFARVAFREKDIRTLATISLLQSACCLSETTARRGLKWLEEHTMVKAISAGGRKYYSPVVID